MADSRRSRRGRPRADDEADRRRAVLDAAFAELVAAGYEGVTMLGIARRAGASKETLYAWFGNRQGLFAALIRDQAEQANERVTAALAAGGDAPSTLRGFAEGLLALLTGERSLALNRAAMTSPELARTLLEQGRHRTGPLVERYLAQLGIADPPDAFQLLYGLVMRDTQIRCLLGEPAPSPADLRAQAASAVDRFLTLTA